MKNFNKKLLLFLLGCFLAVFYLSCEKEDNLLLDLTEAVIVTKDDAEVTTLFENVFNEVDDVTKEIEDSISNKKTFSKSALTTCRVITIEHSSAPELFPMTITIDYGDTICLDLRGRNRRGQIIVEVTGRYREVGSQRIITFNDFYLNDYKIEGTKTVTTGGRNNDDNLCFTVTLEDGQATSPDSLTFTKEFTRTREWIAGEDTPLYLSDDEYLISGQSTGTNWNGINYTRTITTPLLVQIGCFWIKSGVIQIELEDRPVLEIDYGDGECDSNATLTFNGETREIEMR